MAPTGLYDTLSSYLGDTDKLQPPMLTASAAVALSILYTILYVAPFYLSSTTRPSPTLSRDAPTVIRARIRFVNLSVSICALPTIYLLSTRGQLDSSQILHHLGWYPVSPISTLKVLLLTALLFAGPLFERGIIDSGWRSWIRGQDIHSTLRSWIGFRNYIAGPLNEELFFRSLLIPLHLLIHPAPPPRTLIFFTPLYFGIAHVHHFYEYTLTHPFTSLLPALVRSLVQFGYTTVFGWYATFVFLRTGSVWGVVVVHAFCNWLGLPRVWGRVGGVVVEGGTVGGPVRGAGGGPVRGPGGGTIMRMKDDDDINMNHQDEEGNSLLAMRWTVLYYLILIAGAFTWWKSLWWLTESEGALMEFGP